MAAQKGHKQGIIDAFRKAFIAANGEEIGKTLTIKSICGNSVIIDYKGNGIQFPCEIDIRAMQDTMIPNLLMRAKRKLYNEMDNWGDYKIQ